VIDSGGNLQEQIDAMIPEGRVAYFKHKQQKNTEEFCQ